jgi:hypothetical protein
MGYLRARSAIINCPKDRIEEEAAKIPVGIAPGDGPGEAT